MHFGVFPYCKFDQTRSDHKSAKSARTGRRFCTSLALVSLKRIWTSLVWRNHVAKKRVQWWLRWWFFLNEEKYKNYKSILGMLRARPRFSDRRKNRFFWQISRVSVFASCTEYNSAKNATLDASAAAHTAENEAKQVLLVLTCRKEQEWRWKSYRIKYRKADPSIIEPSHMKHP